MAESKLKLTEPIFTRQTKKRYLKFNTTAHLDVWDPLHGETQRLIILKCSTEHIITDFPHLIEALASNAKVLCKIDIQKVNQKRTLL